VRPSRGVSEIVLLKDKDWSVIDGDACRVKRFGPLATVEDGRVRSLDWGMPYAAIDIECKRLPHDDVTGFIGHKLDFLHLWSAFNERGVGDDEEVIVIWTKKHLKRYARVVSKIMPRLWVMVCRKEAFELMTDQDFRRELTGQARWKASEPLVEWKPDVMA
jgi:hypothetical protein